MIIKELNGKVPSTGEGTFIAENAALIGDVVTGRNCSIWYGAVLRGDVGPIKLGDNVNIQDCAVLHATTDFSEEVINNSDIIYMTRVQRERFTDLMEYERVKNLYTLHNSMLDGSKDNVRILHPLPRVNEISQDVDDNPKAYYFQQAQNGLYARQAIICKVLGIDIDKEA